MAFTLVDLLQKRASNQPDRRAYTFLLDGEAEEAHLTYAELDAQARAIAALLQEHCAPGARALLVYPPGLEYIAAFFGCMYAGVVAVPAYPPRLNRGQERLRVIATDAQASVALTTVQTLARVESLFAGSNDFGSLRWLATDDAALTLAGEWREPSLKADAPAFLQYTSGSTAEPKGVMVSHANILHNEAMIRQVFGQTDEAVIMGWLPLYHDMGLIGNVLQPLYVGAPSILMSPTAFLQSPVRWLQAISRYRATTSGGPNFAYELCVRKTSAEQRAALDLSSWRVAFNGAEPIRHDTLEKFAETFASCGFRREAFHPCYGLAEATLLVSGISQANGATAQTFSRTALERHRVEPASPADEDARTLVGCGETNGGEKVVIVDPESLGACAPAEIGEIWVSGESIAAGYWNRPEQSERTFRAKLAGENGSEFLRTGDLGFIHDAQLYVTGRLKDLIIIRGLNHYPQDIELTAELSHPALRAGSVAAFGAEADGEEQLVIVQEIERTRHANADEAIEAIRRRVAEQHEVQAHSVVLIKMGSIPKTSSGKLQRHACRAKFLAGGLDVVAAWSSAPASADESTIASPVINFERAEEIEEWLVSQLVVALGGDAAAIDVNQTLDSFGLDSLAAIELAHKLEANLGVVVPMVSLLRSPSIAELARQACEQLRTSEGAAQTVSPADTENDGQPLSHGQRALWFLHQLAPESPAYNMAGAARIGGKLDVTLFRAAFQTLFERHPALRTSFDAVRGEPRQRVRENIALDFQIEDAAAWSETELHERLATESHRPFDLERGALLRVRLFERSAAEHILLLVVHHIAADFWSIGVLIRELGVAYDAALNGVMPDLPPLASRYADYSSRQSELLASAEGERLWAYWQKQLAVEPPTLNLPIDRPRPPVQTYRGSSYHFRLDAALTEQLKTLGRAHGATLYMTLLAGFEALLYRYTGQEDFAIGSPTSGRTRADLSPLVGYFVNPIVLRARIERDQTFEQLLDQVRTQALAAFEHQEYPFALLVERMQSARDASHSPLFQTMFVLEKGLAGDAQGLAALALGEANASLRVGGLSLEPVRLQHQVAQFDLTLLMAELDGGLAASLQFNTDLFDASTIERLATHFQNLLSGIVADPAQTVARFSMLSEAEERQTLFDWNATGADYPLDVCLHQLFEAQAARTPDAVAVVFEDEQLSYRELERRANKLAHYLRAARGVGIDHLVGVYLERSVEMVVVLLGTLKAGAAYVPLDPTYPAERVAFMLADAGARVVLTTRKMRAHLPEDASREVVCLDADWQVIARHSDAPAPSAVAPDNCAYVMYTSGSTGNPKGVSISHAAICNHMLWMHERFPLDAADSVLQKTPISFDASVWEFYAPLMAGARLVMARPDGHRDPAYLSAVIAAEQITTLQLVPSLLSMLVSEPGLESCRTLRRVFCGGEELLTGLQEQFFARLPNTQLCNLYGPTESSIDAGFWLCERGESRRSVPLGRPVSNTQFYVLDERLRPSAIGVVGELHIGGSGLARGYHQRPDLTAEKFIPHPYSGEPGARLYRTGDAARYFADGNVEYIGRIDQQLKLRGFRIELGELEMALRAHPSVGECVAVASGSGAGEVRLVAYVVGRRNAQPSGVELRRFLRKRLPGYMMPSAFVSLESLPLMPNGKLDRRALPAPELSELATDDSFVFARTPVEEVLEGIWSEVLKARRVSTNANFFELGGHSLLATQVASRLREAFGVEVPLSRLFESPTISELAAHVETELRGDALQSRPPLAPAVREGGLPLSFAQQRLWFLDQLESGVAAYNMPAAVRLTGALNVAALEGALAEIVRRHEALRTNFPLANGEPVQRIAPAAATPLAVLDLRDAHETVEREQLWQQYLDAEARRGFDLTRDPLLRAKLLRTGETEHVLLVTMHHIITDGWSTKVLVMELKALYEAFTTGQPSPLAEPPVQYADYAVWQRAWLQGDALDEQLAYWKRQLAGANTILDLPTDRPRPAVQSFQGAAVTVAFPARLTEDLRELGRREGVTLFMTLLAAFQILLQRYTGESDLLVGSPIANRNHSETEGLIGFFANTLVLRADLAGDPSFSSLLKRVKTDALGAFAHQDVPFERLVEELQPERNLSRTPLFQVMFALQNGSVEQLELPGLRLQVLAPERAAAKFDLTLSLLEGADGLTGRLEYSTDLFDNETAKRIAGHFVSLLQTTVADPSRRISALPLLTLPEQERFDDWNDTGVVYPSNVCIQELFERQVELAPDAVALVFEETRLTYRELNARANKLAHYLRAAGVGAETRVAILLERGVEMIVALVGILKAGGAYVPLDPQYPRERLRYMIEDAAAPVLLTQASLADVAGETGARVVCLDVEWETIERESRRNPRLDASAENLAYVIYTSGSTGRPKGVAIQHRSVVNLSHALARTAYAGESSPICVSVNAPLAFDSSVKQIIQLLGGHTLCIVPESVRLDRARMLSYLNEHRVDALDCTPSQLKLLFAPGRETQGFAPRIVLVGGEALDEATWAQMAAQTERRFYNVYGPTECTVDATLCQVQAAQVRPLIGRPLANVKTYILDCAAQLAPVGVPGELCIGGSGVGRGYLNHSALTAEKFIPDPFSSESGARMYLSGDRTCHVADGQIEFLGRIDQQVKVRGYRIELGEIEAALLGHEQVREVAVVGHEVEDAPGGAVGGNGEVRHASKRLAAYVVAVGDLKLDAAALRQYLRQRLPDYMVPTAYVLLERLPLTPNGKLDRRALPAPEFERVEPEQGYVAPRTPVEEFLRAMWAESFGLERIGVHDNFFDLGGDSIRAAIFVNKLQERLGEVVQVVVIFNSPTIAALADHCERHHRQAIIRLCGEDAFAGAMDSRQDTLPVSGEAETLASDAPRLEAQALSPIEILARDDDAKGFALSFAQQRLWFLDQLEPGSHSYNLPAGIRLRGALQVAALQQSLNEVVRRHESLRTCFASNGGEPVQIIVPQVHVGLPVADLRSLPLEAREECAFRLASAEAQRPFDLSQAPLVRARLLRLSDSDSILLLTLHHISGDGWSSTILIEELSALYTAFHAGSPSPLAPLPVQYADFANWQRHWLSGTRLEA
ncbi:MAG TPA: amino acid adenylation domain-containing protein, partial [Pyrinomonadaceae bacterium]